MIILINLLAIFGAISLINLLVKNYFTNLKLAKILEEVREELSLVRKSQQSKKVHPTLMNYFLAIKISTPPDLKAKGEVRLALLRIAALAIAALIDHL